MEGTGEGCGFFCSPKLPYLSALPYYPIYVYYLLLPYLCLNTFVANCSKKNPCYFCDFCDICGHFGAILGFFAF